MLKAGNPATEQSLRTMAVYNVRRAHCCIYGEQNPKAHDGAGGPGTGRIFSVGV